LHIDNRKITVIMDIRCHDWILIPVNVPVICTMKASARCERLVLCVSCVCLHRRANRLQWSHILYDCHLRLFHCMFRSRSFVQNPLLDWPRMRMVLSSQSLFLWSC
jgi:hypothetical protein